jgi:hypothetical protein
MRKKKLPVLKWLVAIIVVVVIAGSYWLSLERPAPVQKTDLPVELKLQPTK